jgi:transitional endoplasmic reticulum ATPase
LVLCNGPEIMAMDKKEEKLVEKFQEAQDNAPSIILIDEIDSLAPRREHNTSEGTKRMVSRRCSFAAALEPPTARLTKVSALLLQIDALARSSVPVIVIGATSFPSSIDGSLRR